MEHQKKNSQQSIKTKNSIKKLGKKPYGIVYVTVGTKKEALDLAQVCLSEKLAACVNIVPSVLSCYMWQGEYKTETEVVLWIKTRADLFKPLSVLIKKHHSYECPCIVFLPFLKEENDFLKWLQSQLK